MSLFLFATATEVCFPFLVTVMLEGGGDNVLQQDLMKAIKVGVKECQHVVRAIQQLAKDAGKPKRSFTNVTTVPQEVLQAVRYVALLRTFPLLSLVDSMCAFVCVCNSVDTS